MSKFCASPQNSCMSEDHSLGKIDSTLSAQYVIKEALLYGFHIIE